MSEDSIVLETTRRIFADLADPQDGATGAPGAWKASLWPALEEAGLTVAWAPEERGGAGAELIDGFDILRISGRYAATCPIGETLLAAWFLAAAGIDVPSGPITVGPLRAGDRLEMGADGKVSGRVRAAPYAKSCASLAGLAWKDGAAQVVLLPVSAAAIRERDVDMGGERADLSFDGVEPTAAAPLPDGVAPEAFEALGAVIRVQQMAGALETVLHLAATYAQERVAFGRPIAKFQAVQQSLARLAGEVAAALTAASSTADTLSVMTAGGDVSPEDLFLEVSAAKIRTGEAANEGAAIAHQAHGAIGFTSEYMLQRFTRALWAWRDDFGAESVWALRLGELVAAGGPEALWPALTRR